MANAIRLTADTPSRSVPLPEDAAVVELTPFEVVADPRDTYEALNTNSITGAKIPMKDVPITADIYNRSLMDDLGVTDLSRLLVDVAGLGPSTTGTGADGRGFLDGDNTSFGNFTSRGLSVGRPVRDSLLRSNGSQLDAFSVQRVEVIRGPQSLLFGTGNAGAVVNYVSKTASFKSRVGEAKVVIDDEGTYRLESDFNIGTDRLAVRVAGVREEREFWRENIERDVKGAYVEVALKPIQTLTLRMQYQRLDRLDVTNFASLRYSIPNTATDPQRANKYLAVLLAQGTSADLMNGALTWENVDSLAGDWAGRDHHHTYYSGAIDWAPTRKFALQFRYANDDWLSPSGNLLDLTNLRRPDDPSNPTGKWATGYRPTGQAFDQREHGYRLLTTGELDLGAAGLHRWQVGADYRESINAFAPEAFYLVDSSGNFVVNAAQINNADAGRTMIPIQWYSVENGLDGPFAYPQDEIVLANGNRYVRSKRRIAGLVPATPTNPFGFNGGAGGVTDNFTVEEAAYAALFSDWWDKRVSTLAGLRWDEFKRDIRATGNVQGPLSGLSFNLGFVVPVTKVASFYYGYSNSYAVPSVIQTTLGGTPVPEGEGTGHEVGIKFDAYEGRISGSLSYYKSSQTNQNALLGTANNIVNPNGLNGRVSGDRYVFDVDADGIEFALTAKPMPGMNVRVSYQHSDGYNRSDVLLPYLYNDQFNTTTVNGKTVVASLQSGSLVPVQVRSNPANTNSSLIPLSLEMLRDPASPYFAQLAPENGQILNATAIGLGAAGVRTGVEGLPISEHQLGYIPSFQDGYPISRKGTKSTGYAADTFSVITSYRFSSGALKGFNVGGRLGFQANWRGYYYTDANNGGTNALFSYPDIFQTNLWIGYELKIGKRLKFRTQLNVSNVLNRSNVIILPDVGTGTATAARRDAAPRLTTWTNTLLF